MFLDYPLESIHSYALKAAEAVQCAGDQDKLWEMHDRLFANQNALTLAQLKLHGKAIVLDSAKFDACLESGKHEADIRNDMAVGTKIGITGTPSFGIGFTDSKNPNKVKVVQTLRGSLPFNSFKSVIDGLLSQ